MIKMDSSRMKILLHVIVWGSMIGGFVLWLLLPEYVVIHMSSGFVGNKVVLLLVLPFILLAYVYRGDMPEFHTDTEETRQEIEKWRKSNVTVRIMLAIPMALIIFGVMLMTAVAS